MLDSLVIPITSGLPGQLVRMALGPFHITVGASLAPFVITLRGGTPGIPIASWQFNDGTDILFNNGLPAER